MRFVTVAAALAACALAACAPTTHTPALDPEALRAEAETQKRLVIEQHLAHARQLHRVVYPILAANHDLCTMRSAWGTGLLLETADDHGRSFAAAARAAGLSDGLTVVAVAEDSPAARAGLAVGDRIVAAAGATLPSGRRGHEDFSALLDSARAGLSLTVEREGERLAATIGRERMCAMPYRVAVSEAINAYANGRELVVTSGLLRFLANDNEIAVIVGHEIAHNVMGHNVGAATPGFAALYDFLGFGAKPGGSADRPTQPLNQAYEAEADYVGLYLMARAGFAVADAATVYRRFGVSAPSSIVARASATHPSSPARVVMLTETAREIEAKRAQGLPLLPER